MTASRENFIHQSVDGGLPPEWLVRRNRMAMLGQLSDIIGEPPVLTPEICRQLGLQAYIWADRNIDLTQVFPMEEESYSEDDREADPAEPHESSDIDRLAMRNRLELYRMTIRQGGSGMLPPGIQEDLSRAAYYLAVRGIDLSAAPDADIDEADTSD